MSKSTVLALIATNIPDNTLKGVTPQKHREVEQAIVGYAEEVGVPSGGTINQVLSKASNLDGDVEWTTQNTTSNTLKGVLNVTDYGAKLDGKMLTNAVTVNGSTTITSTGANFTSADIGKVFAVVGPNIIGPHLVTNITAVNSATSVTVASAATGASVNGYAIYGTDDTVAWQAVHDAATTQKGAKITAPAGISVVAGPMKTANDYNSQINIPLNPAGADRSYTIILEGVSPAPSPAWWTYAPVDGGTILFSTAQVVTGTRPSVIGGTVNYPILSAVGNAIRYDVKNMVFRTFPYPNLCKVDTLTIAAGNCTDCYFDVLAQINHLSVEPTNPNGIGYIQSGINSLVGSSCTGNYFTGHYWSKVPGECGYHNNNFTLGAYGANRMDFMNYPPTFGLEIVSWVKYGMYWTGKSDAQIDTYQTEHWDSGVQIGGNTVGFGWMTTIADFYAQNTTHWFGKCKAFYGVKAGVGRVNQLATQNVPYAIINSASAIQDVNTAIADNSITAGGGAFTVVPNSLMTIQGGGDWLVTVRAVVAVTGISGAVDIEFQLQNATQNSVIGSQIIKLGTLTSTTETYSVSCDFQIRLSGIEQIRLATYGTSAGGGTITLKGASYASGSGTIIRVKPL